MHEPCRPPAGPLSPGPMPRSCRAGECPDFDYRTRYGGRLRACCRRTGRDLADNGWIPSWCPRRACTPGDAVAGCMGDAP